MIPVDSAWVPEQPACKQGISGERKPQGIVSPLHGEFRAPPPPALMMLLYRTVPWTISEEGHLEGLTSEAAPLGQLK